MKSKPLPSQSLLQDCLDYDPITGLLVWKTRPESSFPLQQGRTPNHIANAWNSAWAGKPALSSTMKNGYRHGTVNGTHYYAHRVIWKLVYGTDPDDIDHDDGDRSNNKLVNLFDRSRAANLQNRRLSKNNTSGYHGVSYSKQHKLWQAVIHQNNLRIHLGWFREFDEAVKARLAAEVQYHYNPNHGRK